MARPTHAQITPNETPLIVDGRTPFVAKSPILTDPETGALLDGRSCRLSLVGHRDITWPIHGTLSAFGVDCHDGSYSAAFTPRALELHLAAFAHERILLRSEVPGFPPVHTVLRVVWRLDHFPLP